MFVMSTVVTGLGAVIDGIALMAQSSPCNGYFCTDPDPFSGLGFAVVVAALLQASVFGALSMIAVTWATSGRAILPERRT